MMFFNFKYFDCFESIYWEYLWSLILLVNFFDWMFCLFWEYFVYLFCVFVMFVAI